MSVEQSLTPREREIDFLLRDYRPDLPIEDRVALLVEKHEDILARVTKQSSSAVQITQTICGTLTFFVLIGVALLIFGVIG